MYQANEASGQDHRRKRVNGMSRRQFLQIAGTTMVAGMTLGVGGILGMANAGEFTEYLKYDALGLAGLVRRKEVKPEELPFIFSLIISCTILT